MPVKLLNEDFVPDVLKGSTTDEAKTGEAQQSASEWTRQIKDLVAKADKIIYLHTRVIFAGTVDLSKQTFQCRFDLFVAWYAHQCGTADEFDPILRFPQSEKWSEFMRVPLESPAGRVGFRATIEGTFVCALELEAFPFDVQAFDIVIQLGRDRVKNTNLTLSNGYALAQNPVFANIIAPQISDQYSFRPLRYTIGCTSRLESPFPRSTYMMSIPASRNYWFFLFNHYLFMFIMILLSFVFFVIPVDDIANRVMTNMTIFLIAVAFKFSVAEGLPKIGYSTAFDQYLLFSFSFLLIDPIAWSAVHLWYGAHRQLADEDDLWTANWNIAVGKAALLVIGHAKLYLNARVHARSKSAKFAAMGQMDDKLVQLLKENAITFRTDGTVSNVADYERLLEQ